MILYLASGALLDLQDDHSIGWPDGPPTKGQFRATILELDRLFGYIVVTWGAFTHPTTGAYWVHVGNSRYFQAGQPSTIDLLPDDSVPVPEPPSRDRPPAWAHLRRP